MKQLFLLLLISTITSIGIQAQTKIKGNKNVVLEHRDLASFDAILIKDKLKVYITESPESKVSVETDENLQEYIITRVSNNELEIYISHEIRRKKTLAIYIGVTDSIKRIEAHEGAKIIGENGIHCSTMEIIAKDNANIQLDIDTETFTLKAKNRSDIDCTIRASEDITVELEENASFKAQVTCENINASLANSSIFKPSGNCKNIAVASTDNGSFKGKDMLTDTATVQATDKADIYINASKELIIEVEDNATIHIYDSPTIVLEKFEDKATLHKK